ncbi:unnamed protein product [Peniophora sp. CBMAI 1063]|nr:unnamed protein product [Peniophora sp. CBMAI 1063]
MTVDESSSDEYDPSQDLADPTGTQEELPYRFEAQHAMDAVSALHNAGVCIRCQALETEIESKDVKILSQEAEICALDMQVAERDAEITRLQERLRKLEPRSCTPEPSRIPGKISVSLSYTGDVSYTYSGPLPAVLDHTTEPADATTPANKSDGAPWSPISAEFDFKRGGWSQAEGEERERESRERKRKRRKLVLENGSSEKNNNDLELTSTHSHSEDRVEDVGSQYRQDPAERALQAHYDEYWLAKDKGPE